MYINNQIYPYTQVCWYHYITAAAAAPPPPPPTTTTAAAAAAAAAAIAVYCWANYLISDNKLDNS